MGGHRCTGDVDTCPVCSPRRDQRETPDWSPSDEEYHVRRRQDQEEARIYGRE